MIALRRLAAMVASAGDRQDRPKAIEASLDQIISEYKRRFKQEAVMRLTSEVRAKF